MSTLPGKRVHHPQNVSFLKIQKNERSGGFVQPRVANPDRAATLKMLRALFDEKVKFLLVGAYAMAAHGYPRATMDIDIWAMPSSQNADAVLQALRRFGAPLNNLTREDLQKDGTVFQIGVAPRRIDLITSASGLQCEGVYNRRSLSVNIEGTDVHIPSIDDLIRNKRASGRTKDLADAEALESQRNSE